MASDGESTRRVVYIPGGFDVLHDDHREFIGRCVLAAHGTKCLSELSIVFGLCADDNVRRKGPFRPFFPFDWRSSDLLNWTPLAFPSAQVSVWPLGDRPGIVDRFPPREVTVVAVKQANRGKDGLTIRLERSGFSIAYVPAVNRFHTSDLERALLGYHDRSLCHRKQVGCILVRRGTVVGGASNGPPERGHFCERCRHPPGTLPDGLPCQFPHAEAACCESARRGDVLLCTMSPCHQCAQAIVAAGVSRLVYLEQYHDPRPIFLLQAHGVQVHHAGPA